MSNSASPVVSTVTCDNEYITVVNKRIRAYKKKIDRILALRGKENLEKDQIELCSRFDVFNSILNELNLVKSNMLEIVPTESASLTKSVSEVEKPSEAVAEKVSEESSEQPIESAEETSEMMEEQPDEELSEKSPEEEKPEESLDAAESGKLAEEPSSESIEESSNTADEPAAQSEADGATTPEKSEESTRKEGQNHVDAREKRRNQFAPRRDRKGDRPFFSRKDWRGNGRRAKTEDKDGWVTMKKGFK